MAGRDNNVRQRCVSCKRNEKQDVEQVERSIQVENEQKSSVFLGEIKKKKK